MSSEKPTITIKEFRMWLQGVEEMQDSAWVPNPVQWKRIREKIDTIEEESQNIVPQFVHNMPFIPPVQQAALPPEMVYHAATSSIPPSSSMTVVPTPAIPSGCLNGGRTPNIDTTNGKYDSNFV